MEKIKTKEEFNKFITENPDVIKVAKFSADWCTPCRVLGNTIGTLTLEETNGVEFREIDVDEAEEELVDEYSIKNIPVMLFFKEGLIVKRETGLRTKQDILNIINEIKNK